MRKIGFLLILLIMVSIGLMAAYPSFAASSQHFYREGNDVFDDWHVCRTRAYGADGFFQITGETAFRPIIALESLGQNVAQAYRLGEQFAEGYPDQHQRAEEIFYFVRDRVRYTPDVDQFEFEEFAQNADELATTVEQKGTAGGDCEDMAILLAVMYKGAGYRSAIVLPPGHAAALVYLPDYKKANLLKLRGESAWVWAEATGRNNPFGWIPERYSGERLAAYEIIEEDLSIEHPPTEPETEVAKTSGSLPIIASPFVIVICLMWIISMFRRRRS